MIKRLGHKIVFEGVETKDQIIEIATMNVDFIQGYYYSKPIDKSSFISFIKNNNK
jgi:EAL domain-containing protein (putative c-di-GMP-specific phosphodiesterase class I)